MSAARNAQPIGSDEMAETHSLGRIMRTPSVLMATAMVCAALTFGACDNTRRTTEPPVKPDTPTPFIATVAANFELIGGYRLQSDFASDGLALVNDAYGYVVEAIAGANAQTNSVHVFDLRTVAGSGANTTAYPALAPLRTWRAEQLFPRWITGQTLRDVTVITTPGGYEVTGIGRVFYNTSPRPTTQINIRELRNNGTTLGAAREISVDLPEQEFSGFIKHAERANDLSAIGAGAYDSGQGSVGGLSYATRQSSGQWTRLLHPPSFGDLTTPRLPRDNAYSCPDGASWVCIPPVGDRGVWSTERVGGGGVRFGRTVLFIATLGYGDRTYGRQSYTFGDPSLDRAVAYFFTHDDVSQSVRFVGYDRWTPANPGEPVIGVALGRLRGNPNLLLYVLKGNAWENDRYRVSPVLQIFRIKGTDGSR